MKLFTEHLCLCSPSPDFAPQLLAYYRDNAAFLRAFEPKREDSFYTLAYQKRTLELEMTDSNTYRFYLFLKDDMSKIIGTIALSNIVRGVFQSCFLGYKLSSAEEGNGYMTEAVKRVVDFAFTDCKLHRIEANVLPRNGKSRRVLEKCGFYEEGYAVKYLKINGVWEDHIHMVKRNEAME